MRRMSGVEPYPIVVASQIGRSTLWTSRVTAPVAQPVLRWPHKTREVSRAQRPRAEGPATRYNK